MYGFGQWGKWKTWKKPHIKTPWVWRIFWLWAINDNHWATVLPFRKLHKGGASETLAALPKGCSKHSIYFCFHKKKIFTHRFLIMIITKFNKNESLQKWKERNELREIWQLWSFFPPWHCSLIHCPTSSPCSWATTTHHHTLAATEQVFICRDVCQRGATMRGPCSTFWLKTLLLCGFFIYCKTWK